MTHTYGTYQFTLFSQWKADVPWPVGAVFAVISETGVAIAIDALTTLISCRIDIQTLTQVVSNFKRTHGKMAEPALEAKNSHVALKAEDREDEEFEDAEEGEAPTLVETKPEDESATNNKLKQELEDESPKTFPQVVRRYLCFEGRVVVRLVR